MHNAKSTRRKQGIVWGQAGYTEPNTGTVWSSSGHMPLITSCSLLSAEEIINNATS